MRRKPLIYKLQGYPPPGRGSRSTAGGGARRGCGRPEGAATFALQPPPSAPGVHCKCAGAAGERGGGRGGRGTPPHLLGGVRLMPASQPARPLFHCRLPGACFFTSLSTMQAAAMRGAAVVPAKAKAFTASRRQQRRAARRVFAVATLEPEAAVEPEAEVEVDSEALYRRFEELIDASMLSFHTGDRVGAAGLAGGGPCKVAAAAAAPPVRARATPSPPSPRPRRRCKAPWCAWTSAARTSTLAASPPRSAPPRSWRWPTSPRQEPLLLARARHAGVCTVLPLWAWHGLLHMQSAVLSGLIRCACGSVGSGCVSRVAALRRGGMATQMSGHGTWACTARGGNCAACDAAWRGQQHGSPAPLSKPV